MYQNNMMINYNVLNRMILKKSFKISMNFNTFYMINNT